MAKKTPKITIFVSFSFCEKKNLQVAKIRPQNAPLKMLAQGWKP
jgi:hypothetical protein